MSVIPWNDINTNSSPLVKLFTLIGVPFAAGVVNFVVLTAAASATNSGIYSIVVSYSDCHNKVGS